MDIMLIAIILGLVAVVGFIFANALKKKATTPDTAQIKAEQTSKPETSKKVNVGARFFCLAI